MQQQIGGRLAGEIGYVGSRGFHLPIFMEVNPGVYTPGQTTAGARLFPAFALVRPTFSAAKSWYDSLQASLRMRDTYGVSLLASYTLGRAQDHVSGLNIGGEQRPVLPVVDRRRRLSRARAHLRERATRCSTSATGSSSASAAELPTPRQRVRSFAISPAAGR